MSAVLGLEKPKRPQSADVLSKTRSFELIQEVQNRVRQTPVCLRYPDGEQNENVRQAVELARDEVANPALFMARYAIKHRAAPQTEVVLPTQKQHRWSFGFPVVVKPLDGRPMQKAETPAELKKITTPLRSVGYQIQPFLTGYTFLKVKITDGNLEPNLPAHVSGAARRLVTLLVVQGVCDFTFTMATNEGTDEAVAANKVTTFIIGARPN